MLIAGVNSWLVGDIWVVVKIMVPFLGPYHNNKAPNI